MTLEEVLESFFITKKVVWSKRGDKLERREVDIIPPKDKNND